MNNIVNFTKLKKIMDQLDKYKPLIESQEIMNVCVVYTKKEGVCIDMLGYKPNLEMVGMLDVAKDIIKEMTEEDFEYDNNE